MSEELTRFDLAQAFGNNPKLIRFFEQLIAEVKTGTSTTSDIDSEVIATANNASSAMIDVQNALRAVESLEQRMPAHFPSAPVEEIIYPAQTDLTDVAQLERRIKTIEQFLGL